jgi:hypothetical protein
MKPAKEREIIFWGYISATLQEKESVFSLKMANGGAL